MGSSPSSVALHCALVPQVILEPVRTAQATQQGTRLCCAPPALLRVQLLQAPSLKSQQALFQGGGPPDVFIPLLQSDTLRPLGSDCGTGLFPPALSLGKTMAS